MLPSDATNLAIAVLDTELLKFFLGEHAPRSLCIAYHQLLGIILPAQPLTSLRKDRRLIYSQWTSV